MPTLSSFPFLSLCRPHAEAVLFPFTKASIRTNFRPSGPPVRPSVRRPSASSAVRPVRPVLTLKIKKNKNSF
uniref:Uncharacterized protein n=1 Tax=Caenorhabditis japonica TaxID=281687 RepID=A0A8R1E4R1_CAEJA